MLQFSERADATPRLFAGRVEHVVSGQATHFRTVDELLTFITGILAASAGPGDASVRRGRKAP